MRERLAGEGGREMTAMLIKEFCANCKWHTLGIKHSGRLFWILFRKYRSIKGTPDTYILCASEAGPPPDDWEPEEGL
jgi:hypothetical protein